ncbi:hypothetical protein BKQ19_09750 [Lacticaseibacillus paracasei]|uniref:restriction endonuclease subunit S n=1 Tax=Lacticaseibacillus paracasei TaxID=1597 RepID=UPI000B9A0F85|nr:restriction endonuclease subunit S [Lacticaseibacillus paracasei]ASU13028.1 hypothetical protein BKQ19_09750 [Lacticaseibacillus paracasei]
MSKDAKNVPALRFKGYSDAWEKRKYGDIAKSFQYGLNAPAKKFDGINKYLRITDIDDLTRLFKQESLTSPDTNLSNASTYLLKQGDVLFARTGASTGKTYKYRKGDGKVYFAGFLIRADLKPKFDSEFFYQTTLTDSFLDFVKVTSQRSGQPGINSKEYANKAIQVPELSEQQRIGSVLAIYDNLIAATQDKIDALEQAKKALLQRLFDQSWRFKGYSDPWEKRKLGEVVERVTRKNRDLVSTRPLTISAQDGLVDQRKFFSKTVASKNISNYFLLKAGDFAYNKSYSVGYPWGAVKRLDKYPSGVLSTLYIVFKPKKINSQFLVTYFEGTTWYVSVSKVASEGARNHGLLNISASDFFDQQLFFPTKKTEQESIGLTIKVLDDLIAATQSRLSSLELLKKALLQDLFI